MSALATSPFPGLLAIRQTGAIGETSIPPEIFNQSRVPQIIGAAVGTLVFSSTFFFARVLSRLWLLRTWKLDDWLLTAAWIFVVAQTALTIVSTHHGAGRHIFAISLEQTIVQLKLDYAERLLYNFIQTTTKTSICVFYLRIFSTHKLGRYSIIACLTALIIVFIPLQLATVFQCNPIHLQWAVPPAPSAHCISDRPEFWASAISNIISDVWLIAAVFPRILELKLRPQQKLALLSVLLMGGIVVIASIVRAARIVSLFHATSQDLPWTTYDIGIWSAVEYNVGIFCASAPAIRPLIRKIMPESSKTKVSSGARSRLGGMTSRGKSGILSRSGQKSYELSSRSKHDSDPSASQTNLAGYGAGDRKNEWTVEAKAGLENDSLDTQRESQHGGVAFGDGIVKTSTVFVSSSSSR